jgi:acetoin utilization protein AcuB
MTKELCDTRVSEWMTCSIPVVTPRTSVHAALRLVSDHGLTALPVCDKGRFVGLVSEKDLLALSPSKATTLSRFEIVSLLEKVTVGAVTRRPPATVGPGMPICEAAAMMANGSGGILPVVEDDRIAGLITWKDILGAAMGNCSAVARCGDGA